MHGYEPASRRAAEARSLQMVAIITSVFQNCVGVCACGNSGSNDSAGSLYGLCNYYIEINCLKLFPPLPPFHPTVLFAGQQEEYPRMYAADIGVRTCSSPEQHVIRTAAAAANQKRNFTPTSFKLEERYFGGKQKRWKNEKRRKPSMQIARPCQPPPLNATTLAAAAAAAA